MKTQPPDQHLVTRSSRWLCLGREKSQLSPGRVRLATLTGLLAAVVGLTGCASSSQQMPASMPSVQPPSSMPSMPSSSPPSMPSSSPSMPSPSTPSASMPSPSMPSPSSSGMPSPPSAPSAPSMPSPGGQQAADSGSSASDADQSQNAAGGNSELEVLEPEESEVADSDSEPTWDDGETGGEPSDSADASASAQASGGGAAGGGAPGGGAPGGEEALAGGGEPGGGSPEMSEEALDAELNSSLEIFEGEMERTITVLASNEAAAGEAEGASGGGSGEGEEQEGGPFDQTGSGAQLVLVNGDPSLLPGGQGDSENQSGGEETSGKPGLQGTGTANETYPRVPGDVGDGQDDDVVARQIREAAINEDDPTLREKLWEEYRNYKRSIQ